MLFAGDRYLAGPVFEQDAASNLFQEVGVDSFFIEQLNAVLERLALAAYRIEVLVGDRERVPCLIQGQNAALPEDAAVAEVEGDGHAGDRNHQHEKIVGETATQAHE